MNLSKNTEFLDIYALDSYGSSYKMWVTWQLDHGPKGGRGARKSLAAFAECQISHVANVLNDDAHFSLEQAERVGSFFELGVGELEFFLLLVQWNRAGTKSLTELYAAQVQRAVAKAVESRRNLKDRVPIRRALESEQEAVYYSSWQYAAIHVLLSVPSLQTPDALSKSLSISRDRIDKILEFLCQTGLAKYSDGRFEIGPQHLHLASDSPFIMRHHVNWRTRVATRLETEGTAKASDLHYSSVVTVGAKDVDRVREILTRALAESIEVIKTSPEESGAILNIDWMKI